MTLAGDTASTTVGLVTGLGEGKDTGAGGG